MENKVIDHQVMTHLGAVTGRGVSEIFQTDPSSELKDDF